MLLIIPSSQVYAQTPVVINEVLVHPTNGNKEWIELFVPQGADTKSYWIDDDTDFVSDSGSSPKKKLDGLLAGSDSQHYFMELSASMFNNDSDTVALFGNDGTLLDQYHYSEDPGEDVTMGRSPDGSGSMQVLDKATQGTMNSGAKPIPTPTPQPTAKPTKEVSEKPSVTNESISEAALPTDSVSPTRFVFHSKISVTPRIGTSSAQFASISAQPTDDQVEKPSQSSQVKVKAASTTPALFTILGGGFIIASAAVLFLKKLRRNRYG